MPLIHLPDPSAPLPSEITPPEVYRDRRRFMQAGLALATLPWLAESAQAGLAVQKSPLSTDEPLNKLSDITRYNNFYEFGVDKADPAVNAGSLRTSPWTVRVEGAILSRRQASCVGSIALGEKLAPADPEISLRIYYAQAGEALFVIAKRYHVSPGQMLAANDLAEGTMAIEKAQRLLIPGA